MSSVGNKSDEDSQASSGEASPSAVDTITLPAVKGYITDHGGRVKHTDIVNHFRRQLSDPVAKGRNRADFKDILSRIALFKSEGGERYIILKTSNGRNCSLPGTSPNGRRRHYERAGSSPDQNHFRDARFGSDSTLASQASCDSGIALDPQSLASHVAARARDISGSTDSLDDELMADMYEDEGVEDHIVHGHNEFSDEEKRWLMLAAICDCQQLAAMMDQNPGLSGKRDFITSALHWGAKLGRRDMIRLIADSGTDINARTGQTALHLAAMQGHDVIIKMLVNDYGADIHARDYAGKKPKDLVKDTVAPDIQRKLGRSLILGLNRPIIRRHSNVTLSPKVIKRKAAERAKWRRSQNPNIHLVSGVTRRAKGDHWTRVENSQDSDGAYTPETRRRLRTMSFLKKKKKWPPEKSESDEELEKRKRRPKSSIVVLTPDVVRKYSEQEQPKTKQESSRPVSTYEF